MGTFEAVERRIARCRIRLEQGVDRGSVPARAFEEVDSTYRLAESIVRAARVELEGAGPGAVDLRLQQRLLRGVAELTLRVLRVTERQPDVAALRAEARRLGREVRSLLRLVRPAGRAA